MPAGTEAIPEEIMDYREEIARVGENLDVLPLKQEVENAGGDWHPSDVGFSGKHDGFPNTNSSNGSFHKQSEEYQTSLDEINGNKEEERGTSPELSKDTSSVEEETNTPRIESLPPIPEVRHIGNETGEPLVEELYPYPNSDVKEVEDGRIPELPVPEILSLKEIDTEEVNEDVRVGEVQPSFEQETRMGESYEATEDMKYEEQEIITYRGRGLVEEDCQGNLPKDGLQTENITQAKELKEKDRSVFVEESKGFEEDEINDLVEGATEPQVSEGSFPEENIDVKMAIDGDNTMENITWSKEDITNAGDDSGNNLASADVSAKEDEIPCKDIPKTRDDNADTIGDGDSKEEEGQGDVIVNDGLSKDRELTSTETVTEETGLPEPEAPSNGDSVSHPETEQQCLNPEASLVKEGAKESGADLSDTTGGITEQVTFEQDDAPMDSNVYREIINNNPDEDSSTEKSNLISESYAEPVEEVNEVEDEGDRITKKGTNTKGEHDPGLTQDEFQPNVAEEELPSSAMASNEPDIIGEDDKSSGFVISEDVEEKSADVSFERADTVPRGDGDTEAYFVKDNDGDTTKEAKEESAKKTDDVSDPIETGEVVEEKPADVSFEQADKSSGFVISEDAEEKSADVSFERADTIPHGDDDAEAYFVKDDDGDTTKEATEESAKKTDDVSDPIETGEVVEEKPADVSFEQADKSSGFVISEDAEEKSADVSFERADTIPRGDDDAEAYFVKDDDGDTAKEATEESAKKTDDVSDPIETSEVVEEKPADVSFEQADTIPHGNDNAEAYFVTDDDVDTTKEVTGESAKETDDVSGPLETDVPIVADSSEDFTLQETQGIHPERENLPETSIPEEVHFVEKVAKDGNDNVTEYASEEVLSTVENQPLDAPSASLEVELESEKTGVGEDVRSYPGVLPLTDAANEVSETQTVEAPEALEEEKLDVHQRSAELYTEISSTVPKDSNTDEQVASNEDSNCEGTTAVATVPTGSKIQEEVVEGISALELDEAPKQVKVLEETETTAGDATNENFEQQEIEVGSKQPSETADQGDTTLTEVPGEPIEQVAVDAAPSSIDLQDSGSNDQSVSTEAPKYEGISAVEVVTERETPEEEILIGSFSGNAEAQIGSSEFFETQKIQGIQEDTVHSEDVQDSVSGIFNKTPAGSGIANDKDSTDIVEKDLIDGTKNDEKINAEEVALETKDSSSKEVSFEGEQGTEVITNDQTAVVDQIEERKEIPDSDDQKGDAVKYDTHSEIEDADDHQVSINEASVEQSREEEVAVEADTNVVSSAEMGTVDAEPTRSSRSVDAESSEERNLTENIQSKDLNEEVAESEEIVDVKETSDEALVESGIEEESILDQSIGTEIPHEPDTLLVPTEENEVKDQEVKSSEVTDSFPGKQEIDMEEEISHPEQRDLPSEIEKTQNLSAADGADITETTITHERDIQEAESRELSASDLTNEAEQDENKVHEDDSFRLANTGPATNEVPENPLEDSTLSEEHQPVEEPAVSQGDTSSSLMEDNNNEDKKGIVRPSEFLDETDSILEIKEDATHFEDVQDGDIGIIDETPSGSVIDKDGDSTAIVEKDLIDGMKNEEKISTGEAALETKNIDSLELEQDEQLVRESASGSQVGILEAPESELSFEVERGTGGISTDQTVEADQTEERKEILYSDDQSGKAIEYTTPGKTEDGDDHQTKISEALVEETKEEKATVEFDSNVVSGTETGVVDTESTQISHGIITESFEERNPTTENVESKDLTDEVTETEEIADVKETSKDAALSHSELVESAVAEENIYDESMGKETSHERESLLVPPEEIEVKDREGSSSEVPDSFSDKREIDVEQEVSHPEQTDLVSSEVETNQISKAEDVDLTVSTITPKGDNQEDETQEVNTSDQTNKEEHAENKIQEDDNYGRANTDLRASEDAEITMGGSAISEQRQYVEEPVLSQGDADASLVDENINKDERDAVGTSEFRDVTNSIQMIREDVLQTEDIQNIESGIINETPAGTGLAEDKGSSETVAKDVISEAKVDSGEVASETTDIDKREVEQYEQQAREVASDLQVGWSGTPETEPSFEVEQVTGVIAADQTVAINQTSEERKEILDSDDQNGEATKYTAQGETTDADDRQANIHEDLVDQTAEEKSAVEVESDVISGTEMSTIDPASAQISRNIDAESFEERNSTTGNIENKEFFDEEGKYNVEPRDLAKEVTKSEGIFDAKETFEEAALANPELVESAVAEEGILNQSLGTKISHEQDSSLVLPEENEAKDREVPSGIGSDDSIKQEQHVEERDLPASEFETTQTADTQELITPDLTNDEASVDSRVETLESEGIHGLPIEDDQREDTQGVFAEEVALEEEIASKDAEADHVIQADETSHKEPNNSIEAKEDEDGEQKDVDEVDMGSSAIVEETVAAAAPATETEDLENKGSYTVADSSLEAIEGEERDINLSSKIVEEAHSYAAGADTPFSERSISDVPPDIQGETLDGENVAELNSAAVSVEDIASKEEALVDSESPEAEAIGQRELVIPSEDSDIAALLNAPHEPARTLQTQPTDDSYKKDSVELTEENKVHIEGETTGGSMIESYGENEREVLDKTSDEQISQVQIDCNDLGADTQTRDVPVATENAEIDQSESDELATTSSDIGELEQIRSHDLPDRVDNSVLPEAEDGGNESTEVLLNEVETKEGSLEEARQFSQSTEITSDEPSDQATDCSASALDVVLEKEIHETVASENDQMSRTIQEVNEHTDVDGVAAVDTEAVIVKTSQLTQSAGDLMEEDIGQMSATAVLDENDNSKEQSFTADNQTTKEKSLELTDRQVEPYPGGEAEPADIEDIKSASIGGSPLDQNPPAEVSQESALLQVSEKESGNEVVQSSTTDEVWDYGNEPTVQTDISQDDLDIGTAKHELGDEDFSSAVQEKEISAEEDTSKIKEVVSEDAVESIDDDIREAIPTNSDTQLSMSSEILDCENAGEHNAAVVSVEDRSGKEEDTDAGIEEISKEFSDKSVLSDITNEVAMRIQTVQADDSYEPDSTELAKESNLHVESMPVDGSAMQFYRENDQDIKDETSNEQVSRVPIDNQEIAVDMTKRDIPETTENVEIEKKMELEEHTTSAVVGPVEQYQSQELNASEEAFLQADHVASSLPSEAKEGTNKAENKEALVEEGLASDGPSDRISSLSTGALDNVQEPETREVVTSEDDRAKETIKKELDDESRNRVEQEDIAEKVEQEFPSNEERPVIGESVEETEPLDQLTQSIEEEDNNCRGGENESEIIKDVYTDIGVAAADTEGGIEEATQPTQSAGDLEEECIRETSTSITIDENDDLEKEGVVEPTPREEAFPAEIVDVAPASVGESTAECSKEEPTMLHVSEKDAGNEDVQPVVMNEVRSVGTEPTLESDVGQDESYTGGFKSADKERDIKATQLELGDRDFKPAVPRKEILEIDASKIEEDESLDAGVAADEEAREDSGHTAGQPKDKVGTYDSYESMPVDGSAVEFYRENDRDIKDETSNEQVSRVLIDNQELAVDMTQRDIPETTENVEIDKKGELEERTTSAGVGEIEQYQSQELNASGEAFLQTDQIDSSLPSEAKVGDNKTENKEEVLVEEGLASDGPSDQISTLSTGALDNVQEPETLEVVTLEDDRAKGTIKKELDDESRNKVEQEDIAEKVEQEFPSNEERPVIGESVKELEPPDQLTQSIEKECNDGEGGENVSEVIKDVYTDIGGVAAADTEGGMEEATPPTQSTRDLEEESIGEMSTTPDDKGDLEKEGFVEPTPREEAMPTEIVDITPASIGESITKFSKEEPTLLHVSEKDAGNEDVQQVVMNEAWLAGTEPTLESDVGQGESYTSGSNSADKERDIKASQLELGRRDFIPGVPTKEILEVDASKITEVELLDAGVAANEEAQEDTGHAAGKPKDTVETYEDESSASESIINAETTIPHGEAEVSESVDGSTKEVIPRTTDESSSVPEKVEVLAAEIEHKTEISSLEISQRNLPEVTNLEDTNVKETTVDILSADGQAVPGAALEETAAEKIHVASDTDGTANQETTNLTLPLEEREAALGVERLEETGDVTAEKYIESRNLDFMSGQADQETQIEINGGETLSDGYLVDKADYELEGEAVEIADKVEPPVKGPEEEAFGKDQMLLEKALENKDEYKIGAAEEGEAPILSEANDSVEKKVDPTPLEEAEGQNVDGVEGEPTDIKAETLIPNVQGSSGAIFEGDQMRTLEESKGTNRVILSEGDAPTAYQDAGLLDVVSPAKDFPQDLPGTKERGLPPVEAMESGDQSEVKLVSKELEGEKYEPGNLQLPEEHEYDDHEHVEHSDAAPLISESSKDASDGKSHKKSHHNLLSGMSSKVKSSISKVKKVITGKSSSHGKEHSPKHGQ